MDSRCLFVQVCVALMSLLFLIGFCSPGHPIERMGFFVTFILFGGDTFDSNSM